MGQQALRSNAADSWAEVQPARLRGVWLLFARGVWFVVAFLAFSATFAGVPQRWFENSVECAKYVSNV